MYDTYISDDFEVQMGQLVEVKDISLDGSTVVQVTYDLTDKNNIDIIYGMYPAVSFKDLSTGKIVHKRVSVEKFILYSHNLFLFYLTFVFSYSWFKIKLYFERRKQIQNCKALK